MTSKNQGNAKITYNGPSYRDKSLNIIHDINKAWQSIDVLKEKLRETDYKLNYNSKVNKNAVKSSVSSNLPPNLKRKRKVLRFEKVESEEPKESISDAIRLHARNSMSFGTSTETQLLKRPSRTTEDEEHRTLAKFLMAEVPVLNDRFPLSEELLPFDFDGPSSPRLTYVNVETVRPTQPRGIANVHLPVTAHPEKPRDRVQPTTVKMAWEPVVQPWMNENVGSKAVSYACKDVRKNEDDLANSSKISWADLQKTSHLPSKGSLDAVKSTEPQEIRRPHRKVTKIKPERLEQGVINPFSWRKGRELILKELGPFKLTRNKIDDAQEKATEELTSQKEQSGSASTKLSSSSPSKKPERIAVTEDAVETEVQNESKGSNGELVTPKENVPSEKPVKRPIRRRAVKSVPDKGSGETQRQSTPKLRHYDQASVRRYIREQREERRKKAETEKEVVKTVKATRQQKLKELQERQKELAKAQMAPISKRTDGELEAGRPFTGPRIPNTLTWIDLVAQKPNQPSDDDDDFAYKRVMQTSATAKVRAWSKNNSQRRFRLEESSSDERVTSSDGSTLNQSSVVEKNGGSERIARDASSKEANERLRLLSEAGRQTVEVLMSKMITSGMGNAEKIGGRAAKLESLKQQALSIQNGIDEEMKRLKHKLKSKDVVIVSSSPLSQGKTELPGVLSVKELPSVVDVVAKRKESWEISLSEGPLSSDDDYEQNNKSEYVQRRSPPRTDEILQLVLASTIFANSKPEPQKTENDVDVMNSEGTKGNVLQLEVSTGYDRVDQSVAPMEVDAVYASDFEEEPHSKASNRRDSDVTSELADFSSVPDLQYSRHTPTHSSASSFSPTMFDDGGHSVKSNGPLVERHLSSPSKDTFARTERDETRSASVSITEELSEGSILTNSDSERENESALSINESVVGTGGNILDDERRFIQSDGPSRTNGGAIGGTMEASMNSEEADTSVREQRDVVPSLSQDEKPDVTKMSPNSLRMRMSAELTYLDTVHDSLDQLSNVERVRAVSMAQQEAVALAQVIQARNVEGGLRVSETFASPLANMQVMQSQAETAKIASETAKQLAETNKSLLAACNNSPSIVRAPSTRDTVAAAAAAAVTAALSQLQLNLRRHRDRADSFLSSLSSVTVSQRSSKRGSSGSQSSSNDSEGSQTGVKKRLSSGDDSGKKEDASLSKSVMSGSARESFIPEDILSEGPISPAPSSDIREQLSRNGDISEGPADDSFTEEEDISFRMFLPSQSHLRSSRRTGRKTAKSPLSDDQQSKRSSSSVSSDMPLTECGDEDDASNGSFASASRLLENVPLFSGEDSFQQFTLTMVKQYMEEEEMRNQHQKAILKLREQALVEKTKAELAWIELQKKQFRIKGQDEKMPPLYKKERGLLLRLKQETADLQRLQEAQSVASKERQEIMKKQQEQMIQLTLSTKSMDSAGDVQKTAKEDSEEILPIAAQVLQGLKKLQASKRYLTRREQKLLLRRKHVEHLLNWQYELDNEEARVQEMEKMALGVLVGTGATIAADKHTRDISRKPSREEQNTETKVLISEAIGDGPTEQQSVSERIHIDRSVSMDDSFEEEIPCSSVTESHVSEVRSETEISKDVTTSKVTSAQVSPRTPSVILRAPLTPRRLRSRIRKESSGSEDSCTVSHSETTSELSDVEGRVHALKEDLRRRKIEAEKLRREHKRKNKDRLKAQEASLLKQIEAYDKFIAQTRIDLQKELEEGQSKVLVRPVIKQPKVAESKRLQKQGCVEGPRSPESGGDGLYSAVTSPFLTEISEQGRHGRDDESKHLTSPREEVSIISPDTSLEENVEEVSHCRSAHKTSVEKENVEIEDISDRLTKDNGQRSMDIEVKECSEKKEEERNAEEVINKLEALVSEHDGTLSFKSEITEDVVSFGDEAQQSEAKNEVPLTLVTETGDDKTVSRSVDRDGGSVKIERKRVQLVVEIADSILDGMLKEALHLRSQMCPAKGLGTNTCDKITDCVFQSILNESIDICFDIYDSNYEKVSRERIEEPSLKMDSQQSSPSSVSERVSLIMAEVNDRRCATESGCSTARRTRPQDLLVLSFPDATSPPGDDIPSPNGSPFRGSREGSLVRRPSSPVLGEPSESNNDNSVAPVSQSFEGLDEAGDEDWFEEDYGLGTSPSEEPASKTQPTQHYQIYPYQGGGYYIREIPNKPPPPYTPPGQAPSLTQATTSAPPFSGTPISTADFKRLTTDVFEAVNYDRHEVSILLDKAVRYVNLGRPSERIEDYFTVEDCEEDITNRSRRVYKQFLLDLVEETVNTIRGEEERPPRHPWLRPEWPRPTSASIGHSFDDLSVEVKRRVLSLLFASGGRGIGTQTYGRKRRDFVDEVLLQELRREEKEWVTYDEDEATVKMQLADSIFEDLVLETVCWMQEMSSP